MPDERERLVRDVIDENQYLSLATTDGTRQWVAPVAYTADDELNLYFVSLSSSRHAQHIEDNADVVLCIFDSQQPFGIGRGVQIEGSATRYSDTENPFRTIGGMEELPGGLEMPADLSGFPPGYRAYKIEPARFYMPRSYVDGIMLDERVEMSVQR